MFGKISDAFALLQPLESNASLFLRLPFAAIFLFHGVTKFANGIDSFALMMSNTGSMAVPIATTVAVAEILAGAGILIGLFSRGEFGDVATRLSGLAAAPVMIGAIFIVHFGRWSFTPAMPDHPVGGMEFQVLLLCLAIYFMIRGNKA